MNLYEFFNEYKKEEVDYIIRKIKTEKLITKEMDSLAVLKLVKSMLYNEFNFSLSDEQLDELNKHIYYEKTEEAILRIMKINHQQFMNGLISLEKRGKNISRKYIENGLIQFSYGLNYGIYQELKSKKNDLRLNHIKGTKRLKLLVTSDLHIGSIYDSFDFIENAFEYCTNKDIHVILNCGDFINGTQNRNQQRILKVEDQVEEIIDKYPKADNIFTIGVMGNHDKEGFICGASLSKACYYNRPDIMLIDDYFANLHYQKDSIFMAHGKKHPDTGNYFNNKYNTINLYGHYHKFSSYEKNNRLFGDC